MSRGARSSLGWKEYGVCAAVFVIILLVYTAKSPTRAETSGMYQETIFIRSSTARKEVTAESTNISETMSTSEGETTQKVETPKSPATDTSSGKTSAATKRQETTQDDWGNVEEVSADAPASIKTQPTSEKHTPTPEEAVDNKQEERSENNDQSTSYANSFVGDEDLAPTSFHLFSLESVHDAYTEICAQCADDTDCHHKCQMHQALLNHLNGTGVECRDARLHIVPVDPLSWSRKKQGDTTQYRTLLEKFVKSVKSAYPYRTFKGSDHVFICLSDDGCSEFGNDLSEKLANGLGSRAIFAGLGAGNSGLQWPCPLRVINLDQSDVNDVTSVSKSIVQRASFMIEKRNRWICADKDHPAVHWEKTMSVDGIGGVIMKQYGFVICAIPKSGSTMTKVLLRRMSGYKDWNQTGTGINQSPKRSGLHFAGSLKNIERTAILHDLQFVKGVVVRHPISRLLSGYLDKIFQKHQFSRVPRVKKCMSNRKTKEPSFHKFVHCLIEKHPNPDHLDHHFRIQSSFCSIRQTELDFVAKQSRLLPEMKEFGTSLDFWEKYGADGWGDGHHAFGEKSYQSRTHDSSNHIWQYYTEDLIMTVYKYYKEDFDRFGFTVEEILAKKPDRPYFNR